MIILSDLSEVLLHGIDGIEKIIHRDYGVEASNRAFVRRADSKCEEAFCELMRGKITENDFWDSFFRHEEWPFTVEDAKRMLSENFAREPLSTVDIYSRITAYPEHTGMDARFVYGRPDIYIVSDHIKERIDEIKKLHKHVFDITAKQFWSCDIGFIKSDPEFFPVLLGKIGKNPNEVIFIDNDARNIASAQRAGIESIRYETTSRLVRQLKRHGFKIG